MHFVAKYIQQPVHPVSVTLVGAGGNGGQMLSALARINTALIATGHPGLHVTVWDDDTVEEPNIGRQLFSWDDIGQNKAICLTSRFNRFYGTGWDARPERFTDDSPTGNIVITCVDNISTRLEYGKRFEREITTGLRRKGPITGLTWETDRDTASASPEASRYNSRSHANTRLSTPYRP